MADEKKVTTNQWLLGAAQLKEWCLRIECLFHNHILITKDIEDEESYCVMPQAIFFFGSWNFGESHRATAEELARNAREQSMFIRPGQLYETVVTDKSFSMCVSPFSEWRDSGLYDAEQAAKHTVCQLQSSNRIGIEGVLFQGRLTFKVDAREERQNGRRSGRRV